MTNEKGVFDLSGVRALFGKEQKLTEHEAYLARCPVDLSELRRYALSLLQLDLQCSSYPPKQ